MATRSTPSRGENPESGSRPAKPIPIIHVLGSGHSGSTLLTLLISTIPCVFAGGHIGSYKRLHRDSAEEQGADTSAQARFWSRVKAELDRRGTRLGEGGAEGRLDDITALARVILDLTGAFALCDNSHQEWFRHLLLRDAFRPYYVHLVRDGRAVVYSWQRKYGPPRFGAATWAVDNLRHYRCFKGENNYTLIRYEDLVREPHRSLTELMAAIASFYGEDCLKAVPDAEALKSLDNRVYDNFIFAGNRMRTKDARKDQTIQRDDEYLRSLSRFRWILSTVMALPALALFGYPIGRRPLE